MRRKLQNQNGVTIVFALVIFLIMALFSYVMVNASLTAVHSADASRMDEQAYLSVRSAALLLRNELKKYPNFLLTVTNGEETWTSPNEDKAIIREIIKPALESGSFSSNLTVEGGEPKIAEAFGIVKMTITKKESTNFDKISLIVTLSHPDYNMEMTIEPDITQQGDTNQYNVSFEDMEVKFQLGIDQH